MQIYDAVPVTWG